MPGGMDEDCRHVLIANLTTGFWT